MPGQADNYIDEEASSDGDLDSEVETKKGKKGKKIGGRTPDQWKRYWEKEFEASDKELNEWRRQASEVEKVYLDKRSELEAVDSSTERKTNLFVTDVIDTECLLYGRIPQTDVTRKYEDADDDPARVAANMMQRILNGDIERPDDKFARNGGYALSDHLRTNFGLLRWRYDAKFKKVPAEKAVQRPGPDGQMQEVVPAIEEHEEVSWEDVISEYVHWRDVKWSPCRVWEDARWIAFKLRLTPKERKKRFPNFAGKVALDAKRYDTDLEDPEAINDEPHYPWARTELWEIWSKEHKKVFWFAKGADGILDIQDDPLELEDFWPCPRPLVSWLTTTKFVPKPEYLIAQDSYKRVEDLTTRINLLTSALRVLGIYDENFGELQHVLESTDENTMVPVPNWSTLAQKGGVEGAISWFPLEVIVTTLGQLTEQRAVEMQLLQEITGRADVQRGRLENPNETATATKSKTKFASKRIQRKQDMFAEFISDAQRIKGEIVAKRFSDNTIRARSNIDRTEDAQLAEQAIQLIREEGIEGMRITVKSESLALPDYEDMQQTGAVFMEALANTLGALTKLPPMALPIIPELATCLKWYSTRFRGTTEVQAAMDRMVKKLQKLADNPPPPEQQQGDQAKVQAQQLKNQGDQQRIQLEGQVRMQEIQAETHAEVVKQEAQAKFDMQEQEREYQLKRQLEMEKLQVQAHQQREQQAMEAQRGALEHHQQMQQGAVQHAQQMQAGAVEHQHAQQLGAQDHQRQQQADLAAHERSMEADKLKAKSGIEQLRMKGQQAKEQAKVKAAAVKAKPKEKKK